MASCTLKFNDLSSQSDDAINALIRNIAAKGTIQSLDLSGNTLTDAVVPMLIEYLLNPDTTEIRLQELWLNGNQISEAGAQQFLAILHNHPSLRRLALRGNPNIKLETIVAIEKIIAENPVNQRQRSQASEPYHLPLEDDAKSPKKQRLSDKPPIDTPDAPKRMKP